MKKQNNKKKTTTRHQRLMRRYPALSGLSTPNLPETSFSCSINSLPVISATEFGSIFDNISKSGSVSTDTLHKFLRNCPTIFLK